MREAAAAAVAKLGQAAISKEGSIGKRGGSNMKVSKRSEEHWGGWPAGKSEVAAS